MSLIRYKNGRPVEHGDFVVGVPHNSNGHIVLGVVLEQMPLQGPCNIRIGLVQLAARKDADTREISCVPLNDTADQALVTASFHYYGDAANFIKCEDGLRLAKAAHFGKWDCPYSI